VLIDADLRLGEAVILCGGLGTRIRGVVADRPKALITVRGRPFLEWLLLRLARRDNVGHVVLATGHLGEMIEEHFGTQPWCGLKLSYSREREPLGTGGALRLAAPLTRSRELLVLNGDTYSDYDVDRLLEVHVHTAAAATLWLSRSDKPGRFGGVTLDTKGRVASFTEKTKANSPRLVNAGVYVIEQDVIAEFKPAGPLSLERDVFPSLVGRGLTGVEGPGEFVDIGTPESLAAADSNLARALDGLDCE
jgi:NDP-sugar pyrophosphorylase family protein